MAVDLLNEMNMDPKSLLEIENLAKIAMLASEEHVRRSAVQSILEQYDDLVGGHGVNGQLFLVLKREGKQPEIAYTCDIPKDYIGKPVYPFEL